MTSFDFLGYTFRGRYCKNTKAQCLFLSFVPAVSKSAIKQMRRRTRELKYLRRTDLSIDEIAKHFNPILQGWLNYYGRFHSSELGPVWRHFNQSLVVWAKRKYKRMYRSNRRARNFIERIADRQPSLFVHWHRGASKTFA
jgi:RNA-directed DNA polymerase